MTFSKPVTGLDLDRLVLTRDATIVDWQTSQTATTSNGITWTLNNLSSLTSPPGNYALTLDPGSGEIVAFPGNELLVGDSESWLHDPVAPTVAITDVVPAKGFDPIDSVEFVFSEPVSNFDTGDLVLQRRGLVVPLTASQTLSTSDNKTWTLNNLAPLTDVPGKYEVSLRAIGSGITDSAANALTVGTFKTWRQLLPGDTSGDNRIGLLDLGASNELGHLRRCDPERRRPDRGRSCRPSGPRGPIEYLQYDPSAQTSR